LETISAPSLVPAAKEVKKAADSTAPEKAYWRKKKKPSNASASKKVKPLQ